MAENHQSLISRFIESSGLDWIPIIFRKEAHFPKSQRPDESRKSQIKLELKDIDEEVLSDIVTHLQEQYSEEESRRSSTETKANQIVGFSAVSMTFIVAFSQFLFSNQSLGLFTRFLITVFYCLIALSFLITIVLASRVLGVSTFQKPESSAMFGLRKWNKSEVYKEWALSLRTSYEHNQAVVNDKVTYLLGAQHWFRNTLILLTVLILILAFGSAFTSTQAISNQPTVIIVLTPTPQPTNTPIPTSILPTPLTP